MKLDRDYAQDGRQPAVFGEEVQPILIDARANNFQWRIQVVGSLCFDQSVLMQVIGVLRDMAGALRHPLKVDVLRVFLSKLFEDFKLQGPIKLHGFSSGDVLMTNERKVV